MGPRFANADSFLVRPVSKPRYLKPGALVAFKGRSGDPVLHRLIVKWKQDDQWMFLTKGDGLKNFDQSWPEDRLIGEAEAVLHGERVEPLQGAGFVLHARWTVLCALAMLAVRKLTRAKAP